MNSREALRRLPDHELRNVALGMLVRIETLEADNARLARQAAALDDAQARQIETLQAAVTAADAKHEAFLELLKTNLVLGTPEAMDPLDVEHWIKQELRLSRKEFDDTYRAARAASDEEV